MNSVAANGHTPITHQAVGISDTWMADPELNILGDFLSQ